MPPPHSGVAIAEKISALLGSWNLDKKLFSITLDNASANDTFVGIFKNTLRIKDALLVGGDFFHMRCCAHILNLMVQDGLKEIEKILDKVRDSIKFVKGSQSRRKKFLDCATQLAIDCKKGLVQDVVTRWNSTYLMIESALYYRNAFAHLALSDTNYVFCPELEEWNQVEYVFKFLKIFYDLTNIFSGAKYPTINLFFHGMWKIQAQLKDELKNPNHFIRSMASKMQLKFDKYWKDCNEILAIGVILDPRYKTKVVDFAFSRIYGDEGKFKAAIIRDKLQLLFETYSHESHHSSGDVSSTSNQTPQFVEANDIREDDLYAMVCSTIMIFFSV
ncbi:hypothetical protein Scep_017335 [Stephania cephalantha]|uniref:hAT-like transposase RNase-H fold domain-containing protein n=1 Tax=Stephania cephalantha TaxID=152367 RepID=A0AAP0NTG5_9MAGN